MSKPIGPICNLDCTYCYYLSKEQLLDDPTGKWRMTDEILETYIRQYYESQNVPVYHFAWQGGEPTLLGVDFFRKVVEFEKKHCPPGKQYSNALQSNGTLFNDEWGEFLHENEFLIGLSVDGPRELHDIYRVNKSQKPTFDMVMRGLDFLKKHKVEYNVLTVLNRHNAKKPLDVYRFLRDEIETTYIQFIPCVEPKEFKTVAPHHWEQQRKVKLDDADARPGGANSLVTEWSVDPVDYGDFLCGVFDEWLRRDVGKVFVQIFDVALGQWMGMGSSLCVFAETCGDALAIEHDGSIYSCDHYVYPEYKLGKVGGEKSLKEMVHSQRQKQFGLAKRDSLPQYCRDCEVRFACNGECPKSRFIHTPDGEAGLNYLCSGLRKFFNHIDPWMKRMAVELQAGRPAANVMRLARSPMRRNPIRRHAAPLRQR